MKKQRKMSKIVQSALLAGLLLGFGTQASAWHMPSASDTNFELDGNIVNDTLVAGDDWKNIVDPGTYGSNSAMAITVPPLLHDHDPLDTIFKTGGSKDGNLISKWGHKLGTPPDKDNIMHASAAAYDVAGDLVVYIHGDRYSNDGDAMLGMWFFQQRIIPEGDGTFSGEHQNGDVLMLAVFVNGGSRAEITLYEWDDTVKGNLRDIGEEGSDYYYATSNATDTPAWSDYVPKTGVQGTYPPNNFFEGGINLSWVFRGKTLPCFSSFLMESRASASNTAVLKDFVVGELNTCNLQATKTCDSSVLNQDDYETLDHTYTVTVSNSGFGVVTSAELSDDMGTEDVDDDKIWTIPLAPGVPYTETYQVTGSSLNPPTNTVTVIGVIGEGDDIHKLAPVYAEATCTPVQLSPTIDVTKTCTQLLESVGDYTVVRVDYTGDVCNISDANDASATKLTGVTVVDDKSGITHEIDVPLYPMNDPAERKNCANYSGSYYPTAPKDPSGNACLNKLSDTVTATGSYSIGSATASVTDTWTATCDLCVDCPPATP